MGAPKPVSSAVRLAVRAKPRAKASRVVRAEGLSIEVALAAPPVDSAANAELLRVLAAALGVPRSGLALVGGETSRQKRVVVNGLTEAEVVSRLTAARGIPRL